MKPPRVTARRSRRGQDETDMTEATTVAPLAHVPYADGTKPFSIGLKPFDLAEWIEPDRFLIGQLRLKRALIADPAEDTFVAEPGTEESQEEVLAALVAHLPVHLPQHYRRDGQAMVVTGAEDEALSVPVDGPDPALLRAAHLVQEDLVVMRNGPDGPRLVAGAVCFPASWSIREKFGEPLSTIHRRVPGLAGTMSERIDRIFRNLHPDRPVTRLNWSIYADTNLRHAIVKAAAHYHDQRTRVPPEDLAIRVERQTFRKMPGSGDVLFTIKTYVDPIAHLAAQPDADRLATALADGLAALDADQLAYKGLVPVRDRLVATLRAIATRGQGDRPTVCRSGTNRPGPLHSERTPSGTPTP